MARKVAEVSIFESLPSVDHLLKQKSLDELSQVHSRSIVTKAIREVLEEIRKTLKKKEKRDTEAPGEEEIVRKIRARVKEFTQYGLRRVVNAAGIILHTGMGRAVLSQRVVEAFQSMSGFVNVQADLKTGKRSQRDFYVERLLCEITGAEAATIVNNNAAATMLALNTLGEGKEVIVSRGQLIEIGGSFRLPEVLEKSGCVLKEIGTTNRTHLRDYENAISERTGLIFRAHPSNYRIEGFTTQPETRDLARIAKKHNIPFVDDLGSGALIDMSQFGFAEEPTVQRSIKAGADLVLFSGDKLVGGPQAGIMLGSREIIGKIRKNPLSRVLRVCKLTLCALEATLYLFFDLDLLKKEHPTFMMLSRDLNSIETRACALAEKLQNVAPSFVFGVEDDVSYMGSGSLPMEPIRTKVISVTCSTIDCDTLAESLRARDFPIFARIRDGKVVMDLRTVLDGEEEVILHAFEDLEKKRTH